MKGIGIIVILALVALAFGGSAFAKPTGGDKPKQIGRAHV